MTHRTWYHPETGEWLPYPRSCAPPPVPGARFNKGFTTDFLGVHPDQVPETRALLAKHGVRAHVTRGGQFQVDSHGEFKKLKQTLGVFDRNAGYGDVMPRNA